MKFAKNEHEAVSSADHSRRKGRKPNRSRGLPSADARLDLAQTYLKVQREHWPQLVSEGILPSPTKAAQALADGLETRFLSCVTRRPSVNIRTTRDLRLGAAYLRYSCDHSNPRSLDQQLALVLNKARSEDCFIPWEFVYADAAVPGTTACRYGYQHVLALLVSAESGCEALFIDEIGRASRDAIEALKLGRMVDVAGKALIGASDGFDSRAPSSKMMLQVYAMLHEWFVDQLRSKVKRGMRDTFFRGRSMGRPALGYKLVPELDEGRNPVIGSKGVPIKIIVVDDEMAEFVRLAFRLYAHESWSTNRIAKHFNKIHVAGRSTWDATQILKILRREKYIGIDRYNTSFVRREGHSETCVVVKRPRKEWLERQAPELRIIPDELWKAAQDRLKRTSDAYRKHHLRQENRTEIYPTLLFRPHCGYCGRPLHRSHSGVHASFKCPNGSSGKHGCKLTTNKSVRVIETALLEHLKDQVFTGAMLNAIVDSANRFLAEQKSGTRVDTKSLRRKLSDLQERQSRLIELAAGGNGPSVKVIQKQLAGIDAQIEEVNLQLAAAKSLAGPPAALLCLEVVKPLLVDLREVLREKVSTAAPILRELLGRIEVTQEPPQKGKRTTWTASFSLNAVPILLELSAKRKLPNTEAWEYLESRSWKFPQLVKIELIPQRTFHEKALEIGRLRHVGMSVLAIARAVNVSPTHTKRLLDYSETLRTP